LRRVSQIATTDKKDLKPPADDKSAGADAKAKASGEPAADAAQSTAPAKKLRPITLIVSALVSFVVFLAIFSYTMGVFDSAPPPVPLEEAKAETEQSAPSDSQHYFSPYGAAAAAVEAATASPTVDTIAQLSLLDKRQRELAAEEMDIANKKRELEALKNEVEQFLQAKKGIADEKVTYIAKLIDGMKAEEMSGMITNMDNATIMAVLPKMKPQTASRVLAILPPQRAAEIATQLLEPES
jgi:flagellar motility protein MotE (MotC chaperone)